MLLTGNSLFIVVVGLLLTGGLLSFFTQSKPKLSVALGFTFANLAAVSGILLGLWVLIVGTPVDLTLPWAIVGQALMFSIGPLSAFFLTVISLLCLAVSVFSYGYAAEYIGKNNVGILGLLYNLFIFSMLGLVASGSALMFLFFWELMSLVSYLLVVYDHRDPKVRRAGFIYVVMTHIGTLFIFLAFFLLYQAAGDFSFTAFATAGHSLPGSVKTLIFLFVTIGFGTKAGIVPLHIWLPKAHPAAPSNVSAIMSGVMLKTAIYGLVKVVFEVLGGGPVWWGVLILALGTVSALMGVMYALMEHDIKRLLAYHSVENIGIILMGIGSALIFLAYGNKTLAVVGLTAGLFHVLNHALFKGLLFLGAGSIHFATRTRDIEKLGGLLKRMPWTGLFFLIGSLAISALPPFNGFVSEWLTFQSLIMLGSGSLGPGFVVLGPVAGALLALTGALAAACFVKAFGIQFLAMPRSANAENAREVPLSMRLGMAFLAVLCLLFGILPGTVISLLGTVTESLLGTGTASVLGGNRWLDVVSALGPGTVVSPLPVLGLIALLALVVYLFTRWAGKGGTVRINETWNCGMELTPKMEYTATSFSKPIRMIFKRVFLPKREIQTDYVLKPYFTRSIKYKGSIKPVFEDVIYRPTTQWFIKFSNKLRGLQSGSIHLYLGYIFVTLVVLLIFAR